MSEVPKEKLKLDEIGYWSVIKLDIIREYAKAYSTILTAQERHRLYQVYIDAIARAEQGCRRPIGPVSPTVPHSFTMALPLYVLMPARSTTAIT
jgi:hypothetical protein